VVTSSEGIGEEVEMVMAATMPASTMPRAKRDAPKRPMMG